jgi:hypothetical protein
MIAVAGSEFTTGVSTWNYVKLTENYKHDRWNEMIS